MAKGRSLPERSIRLIGRDASLLDTITAQIGEIFYDSTNGSIRVYDGKTVGGNLLSQGLTIEEIQDIVGTMVSTGVTHNGISVSYVDSSGKIQLTGFSGDYDDLANKPVLFSGSYNDLTNKPSLFSGDYDDLSNKPVLFSGSYNDLTDLPTIPGEVNLTGYATETYVNTQITNVIGTAGAALNTLGELSDALGDDANFASTVTTALSGKEPAITSGTTGQYWRGDKSWQTLNATAVGLGNVTNESKATMFTNPTFTGTVSGVTATHVGLGNVTNESKATMFTSPTFTGTAAASSNLTVGTASAGYALFGTVGGGYPYVAINSKGSSTDIFDRGRVYAWYLDALSTITSPGATLDNVSNRFSLPVEATDYYAKVTVESNVSSGDPISLNATTGKYGKAHGAIECILSNQIVTSFGDNTLAYGVLTDPTDRSKYMALDGRGLGAGVTNSNGTVTVYSNAAITPNTTQGSPEGLFFERRSGKFGSLQLWYTGSVFYNKIALYTHANPPTEFNVTSGIGDADFSHNFSVKYFYSYNAGLLFRVSSNVINWTKYWNGSAWTTVQTNITLPTGFNPKFLWDSPTDSTKFKFIFNNNTEFRWVEGTFNSSNNNVTFTTATTVSGYTIDEAFNKRLNMDVGTERVVGIDSTYTYAYLFDYSLASGAAIQMYEIDEGNRPSLASPFDDNGYRYAYSQPETTLYGGVVNRVISLGSSQFLVAHLGFNYYSPDPTATSHVTFIHVNGTTGRWQSAGKAWLNNGTSANVEDMAYDSTNKNLIVMWNGYDPDYYESAAYSIFNLGSLTNLQYPIENFVGIAQASATSNTAVAIARAGEISRVHSGLSIYRKYYVDNTGGLTTNMLTYTNSKNEVASNYIGKSISATEILVGRSPVLLGDGDIGSRVVSNSYNGNQFMAEGSSYDPYFQRLTLQSLAVDGDGKFILLSGNSYLSTTYQTLTSYTGGTSYTLPAGAMHGSIRIVSTANSGVRRQITHVNFVKIPGTGASYSVVSDFNYGGACITITGLTEAGVLSWTRAVAGWSSLIFSWTAT